MGDFAKLKPVELLAETQKAIGDARLHALHRELIQERNQLKTEETVCPALGRTYVQAGVGSPTHVAKLSRPAIAALGRPARRPDCDQRGSYSMGEYGTTPAARSPDHALNKPSGPARPASQAQLAGGQPGPTPAVEAPTAQRQAQPSPHRLRAETGPPRGGQQ